MINYGSALLADGFCSFLFVLLRSDEHCCSKSCTFRLPCMSAVLFLYYVQNPAVQVFFFLYRVRGPGFIITFPSSDCSPLYPPKTHLFTGMLLLLLLTDDDDDDAPLPNIPLRFVLGLLFVHLSECSFVFARLCLLRLSVEPAELWRWWR